MKLSAIAAMTDERVIGKDNRLPWHISEDLKRFKKITMGHPVIMGRKTYESMGKPLPGRTNLVISGQANFHAEGVRVFSSLEKAIGWCEAELGSNEEIFVIGGARLFEQVLPHVDRLYLTYIHKKFEGDVFFPLLDMSLFQTIEKVDARTEKESLPVTFVTVERKK